MIAPRAISVQSEAIISTLAIIPTPNVAAKKPSALTIIDGIDVPSAIDIDSFLELPAALSLLYLVRHKNCIIDCRTKLNSSDYY